jgi:hypothetical protein
MGYETYPGKTSHANSGRIFKRTNTAKYGIKGVDKGGKGNYGTRGSSDASRSGGAGGGARSRGSQY